jgi:hypothetical protein
MKLPLVSIYPTRNSISDPVTIDVLISLIVLYALALSEHTIKIISLSISLPSEEVILNA